MRTGQQDRSWNRRSVGCRRPERWCLRCRPLLARREPACCHGIPSESTAPEPWAAAPAFGPGGLAQPHPRCRASWGALNPRTSPGQRPGCSSRSLPAPPLPHTHSPCPGRELPRGNSQPAGPAQCVCVGGLSHSTPRLAVTVALPGPAEDERASPLGEMRVGNSHFCLPSPQLPGTPRCPAGG